MDDAQLQEWRNALQSIPCEFHTLETSEATESLEKAPSYVKTLGHADD